MKFLSAKNKKYLTTGAMWFGIIVFAAIIIRSFRAAGNNIRGASMVAWQQIKETVSLNSLVILLAAIAAVSIDYYLGTPAGYAMAVALGTLTTGAAVVTTFNTTYVPKSFFYSAATQLTGVKITVQGEGVIFDTDAAGLNHQGVSRVYGQVTNGFYFDIANGFIGGKNVIWEFTNSGAQTPTIFVHSDMTPPKGRAMYLQSLRQAVLANSGQDFSDFATLALPSLAAGDVVNVLYQDGTQQQLNRVDIQSMLSRVQNVVNTPIYLIDNFGLNTKRVNVLAGAAQTAYIQRWVPNSPGGMVSQVINNS
jgi:hypothetical protein